MPGPWRRAAILARPRGGINELSTLL